MSQSPLDQAEVIAVTSNALPAPEAALDPTDPARQAEIASRAAEIDLGKTETIIGFGAKAQEELQAISQAMLSDVKNKDIGPAGDSLRAMVATIRGFSTEELDTDRPRSWWDKLLGKRADISGFLSKYETVQGQIDEITGALERHELRLMGDVKSLDQLYEKTLTFYHELSLYIAAGEARLTAIDSQDIPAKEAATQGASEYRQMLEAQELRDLRAARDDLDRRVHDLKLTRQVTMQSLPSIRLVQENDKALITKINSTLINTVPLWETQLAQALTVHRSSEAASAVKEANDLTNELLTKNAAQLRQANAKIRTEVERGVYDIASVQQANAELIATIEDSLRIADEGKARRAAAESDLIKMEAELRDALMAAKSRTPAPKPPEV